MAKKSSGEFMLPFTIAVVVLMTIVVAILRVKNPNLEEKLAQQQQAQLNQLNELINRALPSSTPPDIAEQSLPDTASTSEPIDFVASDGESVNAFFSKPTGTGPFPAIIIVHGDEASSRSTEKTSVVLGERLTQEFSALTVSVDWREEYATGDIKDVEAAIAWVNTLAETKDQPIFLLGMDYGVYLAARALNDDVDGVIAAYGYVDPLKQYQHLQEAHPESAAAFLTQTTCDTAVRPESCLQDLSITETLEIDVSTLILQSTGDTFVTTEQAEALAKTVEADKLSYKKIDDTTIQHGFLASPNAVGFEQGMQLISEWLTDHIGERMPSSTETDDTTDGGLDEANEVEPLE